MVEGIDPSTAFPLEELGELALGEFLPVYFDGRERLRNPGWNDRGRERSWSRHESLPWQDRYGSSREVASEDVLEDPSDRSENVATTSVPGK